MTRALPLQILLDGSDITRYTQDLQFGARSPGGYASASWTFNRELSEGEYSPYSEVTIIDTTSAEPVWEGLLDDSGRYAGPDGESFRMSAVGVSSTAKDINRPYVGCDSSLESWGRGLPPFMKEQVDITVDTSAAGDFEEPCVLMTAQAGTLVTGGTGIGYVHYLSLQQGRQLLGSLRVTDVEHGQDAGFEVWYDFGFNELVNFFAGRHTASPTPTVTTLTAWGGDFGDGEVNLATLSWARTGPSVTAGQECWTRFGAVRLKPGIVDRNGAEVQGDPGFTTWKEMVGDLVGGSERMSLVDGSVANLDDDEEGPEPQEISHYIRPDGVTAAEMLADWLLIEDWATWHVWGKEGSGYLFEWVKKPTEVLLDCDTAYEAIDIPGSTSGTVNEVAVRWRDEFGNIRTKLVEGESEVLDNAGIIRADIVDLGDNVYADPQEIGEKYLDAHKAPIRSGTLTITRELGGFKPWELPRKVPFRVRIAGTTAGSPGDVPDGITVFDVVGCTFDANAVAAVCDLDENAQDRWGPPPATSLDRRR